MATRTLTTPDTMGNPGDILDMEDVRTHARRSGSHWFDSSSMRFFRSRVSQTATIGPDGRAYFVSSEQGPTDHDARRYTARAYNPAAGSVENADTTDRDAFQRYATRSGAVAALARMGVRL